MMTFSLQGVKNFTNLFHFHKRRITDPDLFYHYNILNITTHYNTYGITFHILIESVV